MSNYEAFASDWIEAWNSHDIEKIMEHYAQEIDFVSPFVAKLLDNPAGQIQSLHHLRGYFLKGLEAYPSLYFDLMHVLPGVKSTTLIYKSVNNLLAAEYMEMNGSGKIKRVRAHYKPLS